MTSRAGVVRPEGFPPRFLAVADALAADRVSDLYGPEGAPVYEALVAGDVGEIDAVTRLLRGTRGRVLELASGGGRVTLPLVRAGLRVTATDTSTTMLELLRQAAEDGLDDGERRRLEIAEADMLAPPFEAGSFAAVVIPTASFSLVPRPSRVEALRRIGALLAPGGRLLLSGVDVRSAGETVLRLPEPLRGELIEHVRADEGVRWTAIALEDDAGRPVQLLWSRPNLMERVDIEQAVAEAGLRSHRVPVSGHGADARHLNWMLSIGARQRAQPCPTDASPVMPFFQAPSDVALRGRPRMRSAQGCVVRLSDGSTLLDGTSGLWNVNLGFGNRAIGDAVARATHEASYASLFRNDHEHALRAADDLAAFAAPFDVRRVVFGTAGGATLDAAIKIARQYWIAHGSRRPVVASCRGSYHGTTFGAMGITGEDLGQRALAVSQHDARFISPNGPHGPLSLMREAGLAALIVEPVLGSGALPIGDDFLEAAFALRARTGCLIIADEVATGFGRCGTAFASHGWRERPDVVITSKGLTNGTVAASALLLGPRVADALVAADVTLAHGETQAGTPASCAAISATIAEFRRLDAIAAGRTLAAAIDAWSEQIRASHRVRAVTGRGCFRAVHLLADSGRPLTALQVKHVVTEARAGGVIVHPGPSCVQLVPSLTMDASSVEQLLATTADLIHESDLA